MKGVISRVASAVLAVSVLFSLFSCVLQKENKGEEPNASEQRLVVEADPALYSDALLEEASARIVPLLARVLRLGGGPVLNATQKQKLQSTVKQTVLPHLEAANIYEDELWELIRVAEELVGAAESGAFKDSSRLVLLFRFYQSGLATVDTQKMGKTLYCLLESWLEYQRDYSLDRYENYGYQWYLDDAMRYSSHLTAMHDQLGMDTFGDMTSMLMFGVSMIGGLTLDEMEGGAFALSNAETVMLIRRQATFFADRQITEAQWASMMTILEEWLRPNTKTLMGAQISALQKEGYLCRLATLMPMVLELYRAMADGLSEEMIAAWSAGAISEEAALATLLVRAEAECLALDRAWSAIGASESADGLSAIKKMGLDEVYNAFLAEHPSVSAASLLDVARNDSYNEDGAQSLALKEALMGYLRGYLPCVAFAIAQTVEE